MVSIEAHPGDAVPHADDPLLIGLTGAGLRITGPRQAIARLIRAREGTFTAADLLGDARARQIRLGRATVFRTLEMFEQLGVLERLDLPNGEHAYVPCRPVHHHHVVCATCGRATDIRDEGLVAAITEIERRTGYAIDSHRLELYGRCSRCRATRSGPSS